VVQVGSVAGISPPRAGVDLGLSHVRSVVNRVAVETLALGTSVFPRHFASATYWLFMIQLA